jgi:hypothetical protein
VAYHHCLRDIGLHIENGTLSKKYLHNAEL